MNFTKVKVGTLLEFAQKLAEYDIESFEVDKTNFPCVVLIKESEEGNEFVDLVAYTDFEDPDFIAEILRILEWHDAFVKNAMPANEYQLLIRSRARLSLLSGWLGNFVAALESERNGILNTMKKVKNNIFLAKIKTETQKIADVEAAVAVESYNEASIDARRNFKEAESLLKSVNNVLNAMAGEVKVMEREANQVNYRES